MAAAYDGGHSIPFWVSRWIFGRSFVKRFALCHQTVVCLSVLSDVTLVYCGLTVGWIKMKLGMQVGLGPGHIVLDGDPAPLRKGAEPSNFRPISVVAMAGWIKMPLSRELGLDPSNIVRWGPSSLPKKGAELPNFQPMFIVSKRLDGSRCHLVRR